MTILLSKRDVAALLEMRDVIGILEKAFADLAGGKAEMPQRTPIVVPEHAGLALFMPAFLKGMGALGAKIVTVYKDNPAKYKLPNVMGTILILDQATGAPLALMDGGYLTGMRTGAVAGLATKFMARKDAKVHALFGTGGMARAQAWAVDCARDIRTLVLYSLDPRDKQEAFAASLRDIVKSEIVFAKDVAEAVRSADIVTLITSAKDPIVNGDWFRPGTHINGVGSHAPLMRELDSKTVQKSAVICDHVAACQAEAGDLRIPADAGEWKWESVRGSLGEVVLGKIPGRANDQEITLFKSVGLAIQDISTAYYVYEKAKVKGIGVQFSFMD